MRPQVRGVVDERGEEVGAGHERAVGVEPPDGGVVAGLGADQQLRGGRRRRQGAQDVGEQAGGELAGAARAVAELGEARTAAVTDRAYVPRTGRGGTVGRPPATRRRGAGPQAAAVPSLP